MFFVTLLAVRSYPTYKMSAYIITDRQTKRHTHTHTQCSTQVEILILRNVISQLHIDMFEISSESGYPSISICIQQGMVVRKLEYQILVH